ncbi:MAG: hypothetical protein LH647_23100 [Leptolyngbyaceae cyanobacterium CAN_BIN12]|nr:hypothetical protein [Leptolyngbyaceae cyanobacterium CAN_BIN12]
MFRLDMFSKSVAKASLLISAIAGSVLAASVLTAPTSYESQAMPLDAPPTNAEPSDVNPGAIAIAAVGGSVALCLGVKAIADRKRSPSARRSDANPSLQPPQGVSFNRASRSLQRQLLLLLHDDQAIAERLFTQASLRHPGETPNWYAEKVIYDLERDRGAR